MPHNLTPQHVPSDDEMNEAIELVKRVGPIEALSVAREEYGLTNKPGLNTAICLVAAESIKIGGTIIPPAEKNANWSAQRLSILHLVLGKMHRTGRPQLQNTLYSWACISPI